VTVQRTAPPTGTVTLLFSDIEGSTVRWDTQREAMQAAVRRHDELMRAAIASNDGFVFKTIGDAFCAAFGGAPDALAGALAAQRTIAAEDWNAVGGLRVRMALHTGVTDERDNDYFGPPVNRVARLLAIGHGGQVLVSGATRALLEGHLPADASLLDLGMHRLKDLSSPERVFQLRVPDLAEQFPPLRSLDALPNNLPAQLTPLLGRDEELRAISALLAESRIVTLIGSGGIGKTRTALQVAADLARDDGAWFVDLAPIDDPELVPSSIGAVFNIPDEGGAQQLIDRIATVLKLKNLLIVLDNCEHVVAAAARAVEQIAQLCPDVRVLATSREPLAINGEALYRMPLLGVPPEGAALTAESVMQYGAAALFVARAKAAQQAFSITDQNARLVAEIVRRLDGIALAIELAAPRIKVLNLQQLAQRLDDQLKLLTGGSRNALPRQQTLRAMIAWSYELLGESERSMLSQAAVFRGSWTLAAAEAIWRDESESAPDALDLVAALVDKSLLVVEADTGEEQRYRMLESTREFALERLNESGEKDAVAERHSQYYAEAAKGVGDAFWRTDADAWTSSVRRDLENYRSAIKWGLTATDSAVTSATIVVSLRRFWDGSAQREGRELVARLREMLFALPVQNIRGLLELTAGILSGEMEGRTTASAALELLDQRTEIVARAEALGVLANAAGNAGDFSEAHSLLEGALAAIRPTGNPRFLGMLLSSAAYWRSCAGDAEGAVTYLNEAAPVLRRSNDLRALARLQMVRAEILFSNGDTAAALEDAREAAKIFRNHGDEGWLYCATLLNLAVYLVACGDLDQAWLSAREALELASDRDDPLYAAVAIGHIARIASETGKVEEASRLLGFVDATYARLGSVREPTEKHSYDRTLELIRAAMPEDRIAASLKEGAAMNADAAAAEALAIQNPGAARE
jgi:predicted ATPase/class 3 adenylate cyclase